MIGYSQAPTAADKEAFEALKKSTPSAETHPHVFAWFCLCSKFSDAVKNSWTGAAAGGAKGGKKGAAPKKDAKKEEDDDLDLFGDDDDDGEVSTFRISCNLLAAQKFTMNLLIRCP